MLKIIKKQYEKIVDKKRFFGAIVFFALSVFIFLGIIYFKGYSFIFFENKGDFSNYYHRIFWCLCWTLMGLSSIAFQASFGSHKAFYRAYLILYPSFIPIISVLIFSLLHIFEATSNSYIFYFISSAISFMAGFGIDQIIARPLEMLKIKS